MERLKLLTGLTEAPRVAAKNAEEKGTERGRASCNLGRQACREGRDKHAEREKTEGGRANAAKAVKHAEREGTEEGRASCSQGRNSAPSQV
jgi:hypothetical protein